MSTRLFVRRVQKYGLAMLVTTDEKLEGYIQNVLAQLKNWLLNGGFVKEECQR